ncbi:MAG: ParB/RepB/Spo0J family partition protein [Clostridiales bacterium]|jgi:ParB family chromosome partitioning protein|nr:ParB/RepB/Spo0J family partition protein [Clostridiales bacterium]
MSENKRLGKGLGALIPGLTPEDANILSGILSAKDDKPVPKPARKSIIEQAVGELKSTKNTQKTTLNDSSLHNFKETSSIPTKNSRSKQNTTSEINAGTSSSSNANKITDATINSDISSSSIVHQIKTMLIEPCKSQPRNTFAADEIQVLANSIKEYGIIQPLILRQIDDRYEIIAGERRWRAAQVAGLKNVPAIVRNEGNMRVMELALVENLHRVDLDPIDEALGIKALINLYGLTQDEVSQKLGKSRSSITNSLRLLKLPQSVQELIQTGDISMGHAKVIMSVTNDDLQQQLAERVIAGDLSVRATEVLAKKMSQKKAIKTPFRQTLGAEVIAYYTDVEKKLSRKFGTKTSLVPGKTKGKIEIEYYNNKDLERIIQLINE